MATDALKRAAILLLGLFVVVGACQCMSAIAAEPVSSGREPNPHWATFKTPYEAGRYNLLIDVPAGFHMCSIADSYSSLLWYFVLLDPSERCEGLAMNTAWDDMPDFVVIAPFTDTPLTTEIRDDYIKKWDTVFCPAYRAASKGSGPSASNAPVSITRAGKVILGLDTVACTREDVAGDRYTKGLLAYKPAADPNGDDFMGSGLTIGAYVHMKNRRTADHLVEQIAKLVKPIK